jgi:hypothetical protein
MSTEQIVYLARKLHWSREDIGNLTPAQFYEILKELYFQESVDEWRTQYSVASIMAAIYNTIPRKRGTGAVKAGDFLKGDMPKRVTKQEDSIEQLAREKGIKLPSKELKER